MRILWEGKTYEYDIAAIDIKSAVVIRQHTGMGLVSWSKAVDDFDPVAVQALMWVVKSQNGERLDVANLNFSVTDFMTVFNEAVLVDLAEQAQADLQRRGLDPQSLAEEIAAEGEGIPEPTLTSAS